MSESKRVLVAAALPPLVLTMDRSGPTRRTDSLPRLGRLAWLLTALSLPVLGLTFVDLVHREGGRGTMQAAAPMIPSSGAAALSPAGRAIDLVRMVSPSPLRRDGRA